MARAKRTLSEVYAPAESAAPSETGDEIIALRVGGNTRSQYAFGIDQVYQFLARHHPECIKEDEIELPLDAPVWKETLMYLSVKRNKKSGVEKEPRQYKKFPSIASVISAMKFLYHEKKCCVSDDIQTILTGMISLLTPIHVPYIL